MIELVVVGAHMTGLPLNAELVAAGGVLRRPVRTAPHYRLYALPGGPPRRPGLLRVSHGGAMGEVGTERGPGASIEAELWALPPDGWARVVSGIPAPLCVGTVLLDDGAAPKGFLAEADGLVAALEITEFGGWRAYLASLQAKGEVA